MKKKSTKTKRPKPIYVYREVMRSLIDNKLYFVPKARVLEDGIRRVIGKKYDISESLQPLLLQKYRLKTNG